MKKDKKWISHNLADAGLLFLLLEEVVEGVEAELLSHEELELEAEVHVVVDLLQLAVLSQQISEFLTRQLVFDKFLNLDEAQLLLSPLELVLNETEHLIFTEFLLNFLPIGFDLGVEESLLYLRLLLIMEAGLDGDHLDPALKLLRRSREHGHVVSECLEAVCVGKAPLSGDLIEDDGKYLEVVIVESVRADVVLVFVEGDAGLVEDHEQLLEAVVVGQQLRVSMDGAQLLIALLFQLERQHLCAQPEVELGPHHRLLLSSDQLAGFVAVVETDLALAAVGRFAVLIGTAREFGIDGHLAVFAIVLGGPWTFNFEHGSNLILQESHLIR